MIPVEFDPNSTIELMVRLVFVFPGDQGQTGLGGHKGDTQTVVFHVRSLGPPHTSWTLTKVGWRHCDDDCYQIRCWGFNAGDYDDWKLSWGRNHGPIQWTYSQARQMYHFQVWVSEDKHGLYPKKYACECCYHAAFCENCGGGWEGFAEYGIRGWKFRHETHAGCGGPNNQVGPCGFKHYLSLADYANLDDVQKTYVGNVGELRDFNTNNVEGNPSPDPRRIFLPTDSEGYFHLYYTQYGSAGFLGISEVGLLDGQTRHGIRGFWDFGYGGPGPVPQQWPTYFEFLWDNENPCFCGGQGHPSNQSCGAGGGHNCADVLNGKFRTWDPSVFAGVPEYADCQGGDYEDVDHDGIPAIFDCNDYNPHLMWDLDQDARCDQPTDNPGACQDYCDQANQPGGPKEVYCGLNCTLTEPDNCIDHTYSPCSALKQGLEDRTHDPTLDAINADFCWEKFGNMNQHDTDGDGIGDKCVADYQIYFRYVEPILEEESELDIGPQGLRIKTCAYPKIEVHMDAYGGPWAQPASPRPLTLGACKCDTDPFEPILCSVRCSAASTYRPMVGEMVFPWAPITGCAHKGDHFLLSREADFVANGWAFRTQGDRCRYKDGYFGQPLGYRFAMKWPWPHYRTFNPPDLANSLEWNPPASDWVDLENKLVQIRAEYPYPAQGTGLEDDSWYPSQGRYTWNLEQMYWLGNDHTSSEYWIDPADLDRPDVIQCTYKDIEFNPDFLLVQMVKGYAYHEEPMPWWGPYVWAIVQDPATEELATISLQGSQLSPRKLFRRVVTTTGEPLPTDGGEWTSALLNAEALGLPGGPEERIIVYYHAEAATQPLTELPIVRVAIHAGLVEGEDNPWLRWEEIFGRKLDLGVVRSARVFYHKSGKELLVVGQTTDASNVAHPNSVFSLSLTDGSVSQRRELYWLRDLQGYSVAVDQVRSKAYFVGGYRPGKGAVAEVWAYDLQNEGYRRISTGTGIEGRIRPGVAIDLKGRRLFVYGGTTPDKQALSDLWEISMITGEWRLVAQTGGPAFEAGREPFLLFDPSWRRLWLAKGTGQHAELRAWAMDTQEWDVGLQPTWQEQVLLQSPPVEPGHYRGQLRYGSPAIILYTVPETAAYGQGLVARLTSNEPRLKLVLKDARGVQLNESRGTLGTQSLLWTAMPGQAYQLVVMPGPGYPGGTSAFFDLVVAETALAEVATYVTGWEARDVDVSEDKAFLACKQGVEAISLGAAPTLISRFPLNKSRTVAVMGRYLVVGVGPGQSLKIVDALDSENMQLRGEVFTLGMTRQVALRARKAYTAQGLFGVSIFNLEDPSNPHLEDTLSGAQPWAAVLSVKVHGNHLFVGRKDQIVKVYRVGHSTEPVADIATKERPVAMSIQGSTLVVAELERVRAQKCLAGVSCWPPDLVEVFDIADIEAPVKTAELDFNTAKVFFGRLTGDRLVLRRADGFQVLGEQQTP